MREYELIYLIQPDATPERQKEIHGRVDEIVAQQSGVLLLRDDWGKRNLAYEIDKFQKAEYVLLSYLGDGKIVEEVERSLRLDPDILRFLTVKVSDEVKDIDTRITEARAEEAERSKRREERERLEAERAAVRQAAVAAEEARAAEAVKKASADSVDEKPEEAAPDPGADTDASGSKEAAPDPGADTDASGSKEAAPDPGAETDASGSEEEAKE